MKDFPIFSDDFVCGIPVAFFRIRGKIFGDIPLAMEFLQGEPRNIPEGKSNLLMLAFREARAERELALA